MSGGTVEVRKTYACVLCRVVRVDYERDGRCWHSLQDTEFTDWYRLHHPSHEHVWRRSDCTRGISKWGTTTFCACGHIHPIFLLPARRELEFAQKADAATLDVFFKGLLSTNLSMQQQSVEMAKIGAGATK